MSRGLALTRKDFSRVRFVGCCVLTRLEWRSEETRCQWYKLNSEDSQFPPVHVHGYRLRRPVLAASPGPRFRSSCRRPLRSLSIVKIGADRDEVMLGWVGA